MLLQLKNSRTFSSGNQNINYKYEVKDFRVIYPGILPTLKISIALQLLQQV